MCLSSAVIPITAGLVLSSFIAIRGALSDMFKLEDIKKDAQIRGLKGDKIVRIVHVEWVGTECLSVFYVDQEGKPGTQSLFRSDESRLEIAKVGRPWGFDAPGSEFKLGLEAYRINLAHLFDPMMAVHTSNVDPLPHQISAVYESMLPRQPLRFVLADDPGAGKTIMAGLYIRELIMRADAKRILIVSPGSLTEQWQDELLEKFGLTFEILSREKQEQCPSGNYFEEQNQLIARLDQLSRNEDFQEKLRHSEWDLIIVDEAHKMSAHYFGSKVNETARFKLGKLLGTITRHYLLMTATPHNGKEEDFQLFLSLLDGDRFYGKFREGVHKVDISDMMRRMVKEDLLKFDGTPLFPERIAYTANYELSPHEAALYAEVTDYVRNEMNRADNLDGKRKGTVGFALTQLQRRLASSPEAIYQSIKRRRKRLESRLEEEKLVKRGHAVAETLGKYNVKDVPQNIDEAEDEMLGAEYEDWVEDVVDQATAAQTTEENDLLKVAEILKAPWLTNNLDNLALAHASQQLVPLHYQEVKARRELQANKILAAVNERLVKEINYWSARYIKLTEDVAAGKQPQLQPDNAKRRVEELTARLEQRKKELSVMADVVSSQPVVIGGALVIPQGLLAQLKGEAPSGIDAAARKRVEQIAMQAVMQLEQSLGHDVKDVSAEKCGWDITSQPPKTDKHLALARHIEVKGRSKGQSTITVSRNEIIYGLNQTEQFILAIVIVEGESYAGPYYLTNPFKQEPDFGVASINYDLEELLSKSVRL